MLVILAQRAISLVGLSKDAVVLSQARPAVRSPRSLSSKPGQFDVKPYTHTITQARPAIKSQWSA